MSTSALLINFLIVLGSATLYQDAAEFCSSNGLTFLTITSTKLNKREVMQMTKATHARNLMTRVIEFKDVPTNHRLYSDALLLLLDINALEDSEEFRNYLAMTQFAKIKRTLMVFTSILSERHLVLFQELIKLMNDNAIFQVLYERENDENSEFHQVISIKSGGAVINPQTFNQFGHMIEDYNLQGMKLFGISLPWLPAIEIDGCDEYGKNCQTRFGLFPSIIDEMGKLLNFTWEDHREINDNWGLTPVRGPYNRSGTFEGVFGAIVNGEYMFNTADWVWIHDRYELVDFISVHTNGFVLISSPKTTNFHISLFIRPFTSKSWIGICIIIIVSIIILSLPQFWIAFYKKTESRLISVTVIWIFFVLLQSYYKAGLTMFFSSKDTFPFENLSDVMREYPNWDFKIMAGTEVIFERSSLSADDKDVENIFLQNLKNEPHKNTFKTMKEGLDFLKQDQTVIFALESMLKGYFKTMPHHDQKLEVFGKARQSNYYNMIVPWKSPLKPLFSKTIHQLRESGTIEYFKLLWEGKCVSSSESKGVVNLVSLSLGHMIFVFLLLLSYHATTLIILGCEIVYAKLKKKFEPKEPSNQSVEAVVSVCDDPSQTHLDFEYIKIQYDIVKSYLNKEADGLPMTDDVLEALKFVQLQNEIVMNHKRNGNEKEVTSQDQIDIHPDERNIIVEDIEV